MGWETIGFFGDSLDGSKTRLDPVEFLVVNAEKLQIKIASNLVQPHWYLAGNLSIQQFQGSGPLTLPEVSNRPARLGEQEITLPSLNTYLVQLTWVRWLVQVQVEVYALRPATDDEPLTSGEGYTLLSGDSYPSLSGADNRVGGETIPADSYEVNIKFTLKIADLPVRVLLGNNVIANFVRSETNTTITERVFVTTTQPLQLFVEVEDPVTQTIRDFETRRIDPS